MKGPSAYDTLNMNVAQRHSKPGWVFDAGLHTLPIKQADSMLKQDIAALISWGQRNKPVGVLD